MSLPAIESHASITIEPWPSERPLFLLALCASLALWLLATAACSDSSEPGGGPTEQIVYLGAMSGYGQIYVMGPDGSGKTVISADPTASYDLLDVARVQRRVLFRNYATGVFWMNADGSGVTGPLPQGSDFHWSPDATRVVYGNGVQDEPGHHLFVANADGSDALQLTTGPAFDDSPDWSPDGGKILFQRSGSAVQTYVVNADGSGLTALTPADDFAARAAWSPDGARIAYLKGIEPERGVWIMNADGTDRHRVSSALCTNEPPVWSPDGQTLLCIAPAATQSYWYAYRIKADGTESLNLTPQTARFHHYSWSDDGARILFQGPTEYPSDVWVMNADGSGVINLTHDPQTALAPFWVAAE
jgi:TolB protein